MRAADAEKGHDVGQHDSPGGYQGVSGTLHNNGVTIHMRSCDHSGSCWLHKVAEWAARKKVIDGRLRGPRSLRIVAAVCFRGRWRHPREACLFGRLIRGLILLILWLIRRLIRRFNLNRRSSRSVNLTVNSTVNSSVNSTVNSAVNSTVNSLVNSSVNSSVNPSVNSSVNSLVNSSVNSSVNLLVNSSVDLGSYCKEYENHMFFNSGEFGRLVLVNSVG